LPNGIARALASLLLGLLVSPAPACRRPHAQGPQRLLERATTTGRLARVASLSKAGVRRPALVESATYEVALPRRPLLTFGLAVTGTTERPAGGEFRVTVKAGGGTLLRRSVGPRAHAFEEFSLPLEGLGSEATLQFRLQGEAAAGKDVALLGVSDPTIHDLDDYGRARGVVLISIDTLRRDHVSAYGYAKPTTPRLDALARAGLLCEDAVSTSSWTLPAHLSLLTSVDPGRHGGVDVDHVFNKSVPTLASLFRDAGYATRAITSHLYVSAAYGADTGFDQLDFRYDRKAADVADLALQALDQVGDRPFFLFLHFYDPHTPLAPPARTRALFPSGYSGPRGGLLQHFRKLTRETVPPGYVDHLLALYDAEIRSVDDEIGRVLDHLRFRGLERNTLVAVTSDHGEEFLEHGAWAHEKTLYEELVRIPLIVHGPGVSARRETAQVSLLDVLPTLLGWAGLPVPTHAQGRSLLGAVTPREAFGETDHAKDGTRKLYLRGGQRGWKVILSLDREDGSLRRQEWYDLAVDARERLSTTPDAAAAGLDQRALARWREARAGGPAPTVSLTPDQVQQLRTLGYIN
jgi:arylsulfatase A-like enzyme